MQISNEIKYFEYFIGLCIFSVIVVFFFYLLEKLLKHFQEDIERIKKTKTYRKSIEFIGILAFCIGAIFYIWFSLYQCSHPTRNHGAEQEYPY